LLLLHGYTRKYLSFGEFNNCGNHQCFSSTDDDESVAPGAGVRRAAPAARRPAAQHEHSGQPERGQRDPANAAQPRAAAAEDGLSSTAQGNQGPAAPVQLAKAQAQAAQGVAQTFQAKISQQGEYIAFLSL
jgi:hypothetical protein